MTRLPGTAKNPHRINLFPPLFYRRVEPLDAIKHRNFALREKFGFDLARYINAVPVNLVELPYLCRFYPLAFSSNNSAPHQPLGLSESKHTA